MAAGDVAKRARNLRAFTTVAKRAVKVRVLKTNVVPHRHHKARLIWMSCGVT
jgi:hypothetical protein